VRNPRKCYCEFGKCRLAATHWIWTRQRRYPSGQMVECNTSACDEHAGCIGYASHRDDNGFIREETKAAGL
jgi:hypothetical protein